MGLRWPRRRQLGLEITEEQIAELEAHKDDINYAVAEERERLVRHDVMSHVYAYGRQCPKAAGDHPPGATSRYVGDNTDVVILRGGQSPDAAKCAQVVKTWRPLPKPTGISPAWAIPTSSPPSSPPWASGPPCGSMS